MRATKTLIPYNNLYAQYADCKKEVDSAIKYCLSNSCYSAGKVVEKFEESFAYCVQAHACAGVNSGSSALLLALKALDIGPGDEVITTPFTFIATPEAIVNAGATPVFVDIDDNYLIDVEKVEDAITDKTKAILIVDMFGQCANLEKLRFLSNKHNIKLIQDAAHSAGSFYDNVPVGSGYMVDATCFSFNPVKNLGAIGNAGGVTGSTELIDKVKMLRTHGRTPDGSFEMIGVNAMMDGIQAKVLTAKLPYLQIWIQRKREVCEYYSNNLDMSKFVLPSEVTGNYHSYYSYVVECDDRDGLATHLANHEIQSNIQYPVCHTQPAYSNFRSECPNAEYISKRVLSIPSSWYMSQYEKELIVETMNSF